jgi:hypothetical protein
MVAARFRPLARVGIYTLLAVAVLVAVSAQPASAGVTLTETEFAEADWTFTPLGDAPQDFAVAEQVTTGGNPGAYRRTSVRPEDHYYDALNTRIGWVYDPGESGAISRIDWSVDVLKLGSPPKGWAGIYNLVLIQNGVVYEDRGRFAGVQASQPGWYPWPEFVGRVQDDFELLGGDGTQHPDFSRGGAPIFFGYVVSGPQSGGVSGIDNLEINIINGGGGGGDEGPNLTGEWAKTLVITSQPGRRNTTVYTLEALVVTNDGTKKAGSKKKRPKATFFLSNDGSLDGTDVQVGSKTLSPLKAGASKRYVLRFTLPSNINLKKASGKFLIAVLDSKHKLSETDETDNTIVTQIP